MRGCSLCTREASHTQDLHYAAVALIAFAPLWTAALTITLQPVTVTTISASGVMGGVFWDAAQNCALGFILNGKRVTVLPKPTTSNRYTAVASLGFGPNGSVAGYFNCHARRKGRCRLAVFYQAFSAVTLLFNLQSHQMR